MTSTILYAAGIIAVGAAAYLLGRKTEQEKSKNWTIKEDVTIDGEQIKSTPVAPVAPTTEPAPLKVEVPEDTIQPEIKLFPITQTIQPDGRGQGAYNKLVSDMRFEGFKTLAFAVSGYNTNFDYMSEITKDPNGKFAVILDEIQTNPTAVQKVQQDLADFDTDNIRLYTIQYQA